MGMWENEQEQHVSGHDNAQDQEHPPTLRREPKCQDSGKSDPFWMREKMMSEDTL